jgi:hypothetical protein
MCPWKLSQWRGDRTFSAAMEIHAGFTIQIWSGMLPDSTLSSTDQEIDREEDQASLDDAIDLSFRLSGTFETRLCRKKVNPGNNRSLPSPF